MDFTYAMLMFFSGVFAHIFALRIFRVWSKSLMYRATFVRCLHALKMTDEMSQELLKSSGPENAEQIKVVFDYWRTMSLYALQNSVNDKEWRNIAVSDWKIAMKILEEVNKRRANV
jgi:hypothetical protein